MRARALIVGVVVIVIGLGVVAWTLIGSDSPDPLSLEDIQVDDRAAPTRGPSLDGLWVIDAEAENEAGLRIGEKRFGGLADHTAVGRTSEISGEMRLRSEVVEHAEFQIDLSSIEFTDDPGIPVAGRSDYLRDQALETDRFPQATFELTEALDLPPGAVDGEAVTATAEGELTLHGVTRPVTFDVDARRSGDSILIATAEPVPVVLADHGIEAPRLAGVSEVEDTGSFEFAVVLAAV